jgi:hypothetical protein
MQYHMQGVVSWRTKAAPQFGRTPTQNLISPEWLQSGDPRWGEEVVFVRDERDDGWDVTRSKTADANITRPSSQHTQHRNDAITLAHSNVVVSVLKNFLHAIKPTSTRFYSIFSNSNKPFMAICFITADWIRHRTLVNAADKEIMSNSCSLSDWVSRWIPRILIQLRIFNA